MNRTSIRAMSRHNRARALIRIIKELRYIAGKTNNSLLRSAVLRAVGDLALVLRNNK